MKAFFSKKNVCLGLIFLIAFLLRVYSWTNLGSLTWDEAAHSMGGVMIAKFILGGFHSNFAFDFISNYPVTLGSLFFYPYFYSIFSSFSFLLFGFSEFSARLPNFLFSFIIIHASYLLSKKMFNEKIALITAFIVAVNPWFIMWGGRIVNDIIMVSFIVYSVFFLRKALDTEERKDWILSGMFAGFAGLIKPTGFILIVPIAILVIFSKKFKFLTSKNFLSFIAIFSLLAISYFGIGIVAKDILPKTGIISQQYGDAIHSDIFHWFGKSLTNPEEKDPNWKTLEGWTFYPKMLVPQVGGYFVLMLSILGMVVLIYRKENRKFYFFAFFILFIMLVFTFIDNKDSRYTMPYIVFFCILSSIGANFLSGLLNEKYKNIFLAIVLLGVFASSFAVINNFEINKTPYTYLNEVSEAINNDEPGGAVQLYGSNNDNINEQTLSFYLSIKDKELNHAVFWADKDGIEKAKYVISEKELNLEKLYSPENYKINLYKKESG